MQDRLDPDRLRLDRATQSPSRWQHTTPRRPSVAGHFLKGPIPWVWLSAAARLPGRALHVAVSLRFWTGIKRTNHIALSVAGLAVLGVSRQAAYRALKTLETAGLIAVDRHRGRKPWVTVIEIDADE